MSYRLKSPLKSPVFCLRSSLLAALLLQGCQSYTIVQRNVFVDDDGQTVYVDYGRSESDHVNTFVSPATGAEMDFKSKLMVKVELPDGDTFKAWQCMNFLPRGTMYQSDNEEWKALANGFSFIVYRRTGEPAPRDYLEVYRGVLCDTPPVDVKKDDRWHEVLQRGREYKRPRPVQQEKK